MCWGINAHSFDIIGVYIPLTRTSAISARPLTSKPWTGGLCVQSDPTARDKFLQCTCDPGGSTGFARLRPRSSLATRKISSSWLRKSCKAKSKRAQNLKSIFLTMKNWMASISRRTGWRKAAPAGRRLRLDELQHTHAKNENCGLSLDQCYTIIMTIIYHYYFFKNFHYKNTKTHEIEYLTKICEGKRSYSHLIFQAGNWFKFWSSTSYFSGAEYIYNYTAWN